MKNFFRLLLCVACAYVMAGCEKEEKEEWREYGNLVFENDTITLVLDDTTTIRYSKSGYWKSTTPEPTCISLDESIVSVDENGNITANNFGETDIVYSVYDTKWKCHIVVNDIIPLDDYSRNWLINKGYDTNNDGLINIEEASSVDTIVIRDSYVTYIFNVNLLSYTNHFKGLKYLYACCYCTGNHINISNLNNLDYIFLSIESQNSFYANISNLSNLKTIRIYHWADQNSKEIDKYPIFNITSCNNIETFWIKNSDSIVDVDFSDFSIFKKYYCLFYNDEKEIILKYSSHYNSYGEEYE